MFDQPIGNVKLSQHVSFFDGVKYDLTFDAPSRLNYGSSTLRYFGLA